MVKKINWTRRNKLFAGLGGLGAVLLAVFLVFTFVGVPGGDKLFGTAQVDPGYWREEGYKWVTDSVPFKVAVEWSNSTPIGNPLGYPKEYTNERAQFDVIYQWVKKNISLDGSIKYNPGSYDKITLTEESSSVSMSNGTSIPTTWRLSQSQTKTSNFVETWSIKSALKLGATVSATVDAGVFKGGVEAVAEFNTEVNSQFQQTTQTGTTISAEQSFTVPPYRKLTTTFTTTPLQVTGTWVMTVVPRVNSDAAYPVVTMNYAPYNFTARPPDNPNTYEVSGDYTREERMYDYVLTEESVGTPTP